MREIWRRIEAWLAGNLPTDVKFVLPAGASEEAILQAQTVLGLELPDDVCESYMIHDGDKERGLFTSYHLLSLDAMTDTWWSQTQGLSKAMREYPT